MILWICAISTLIVQLECRGDYATPTEDPVYCYDCHYDPDAEKEAYDSQNIARYPGYPKCALNGGSDEPRVDRWPCKTGKCFIRRDPNGLVYRGCADPWNLPWQVDHTINCEYQPQQKPSLWWFCEGSKCNGGSMGQGDICPDPPPAPAGDSYGEPSNWNPEEVSFGESEVYGGETSFLPEPPAPAIYEPLPPLPKSQPMRGKSFDSKMKQSKDYAPSKSGYNSKGKEGNREVDVYGVYTAEVAPIHPKVQGEDQWMMPLEGNGYPDSIDHSDKQGYNMKSSGKNHYKSEAPQKSSLPKSNSKHYKSYSPEPHYKSQSPKKSSSHSKSYGKKSAEQPFKSVSPPKSDYRHSKSMGNGYGKKPSMPILPPAPRPNGYKPKPLTQPVDYVHGLYNQELKQQEREKAEEIYNKPAIREQGKASYGDQVDDGYSSKQSGVETGAEYEPYTQQQPSQMYGKEDGSYGYENGYGQENEVNFQGGIPELSSNPCDGSCTNNPSGLFPHEERDDWFIQCGSGMDKGRICHCCKPYYLRCPKGAMNDITRGICGRMTSYSGNPRDTPRYKPLQ